MKEPQWWARCGECLFYLDTDGHEAKCINPSCVQRYQTVLCGEAHMAYQPRPPHRKAPAAA